MSCRSKNWLFKQALKEARKGRHKDALVGALLIRGGSVVARASNMSRPFGCSNRGFHAEERVLKNRDARGLTLVVVRANRNGKPATMSRPCEKCLPLIIKKGVKKVIYINWNGNFVEERIESCLEMNYVQ